MGQLLLLLLLLLLLFNMTVELTTNPLTDSTVGQLLLPGRSVELATDLMVGETRSDGVEERRLARGDDGAVGESDDGVELGERETEACAFSSQPGLSLRKVRLCIPTCLAVFDPTILEISILEDGPWRVRASRNRACSAGVQYLLVLVAAWRSLCSLASSAWVFRMCWLLLLLLGNLSSQKSHG